MDPGFHVQAGTQNIRIRVLAQSGAVIVKIPVEVQISIFHAPVTILCLDIDLGRQGRLHKDVIDILIQIVVFSKAVCFIVVLPRACRERVVYAGQDNFIPPGLLIPDQTVHLGGKTVSREKRIELVE